MRKTDIDLLFAYNRWANAKILSTSVQLNEEQQTAPGPVSFGSLMGTLVHIYGAEQLWRMRLQHGVSPRQMPSPNDFPNFASLASKWAEEETEMLAFLQLLQEEDLNRVIAFKRLNGSMEEATVWKALLHIVLHGMQFRAEAGILLSSAGQSPGDLDFIKYLRDIGAR
jgi:uncharacterized damage-inducible protein DinB